MFFIILSWILRQQFRLQMNEKKKQTRFNPYPAKFIYLNFQQLENRILHS